MKILGLKILSLKKKGYLSLIILKISKSFLKSLRKKRNTNITKFKNKD